MWVIRGYCPQSYIHMFLYVLSTITFQTSSGSFSRHRSLKETSIWLTDLQVSVSVQTGTFQKIANNIYIMEMPILGLMIPKKNAAVCNGMTIVLYEMEGATWHQNLRVFCPVFQDGPCMKWCWFFHFIRGMGSSIPYRYSQGGSKLLSGKCSSGGRKSFPVWHLINIIIRSRGSSILISRGLRGGSYFKSE